MIYGRCAASPCATCRTRFGRATADSRRTDLQTHVYGSADTRSANRGHAEHGSAGMCVRERGHAAGRAADTRSVSGGCGVRVGGLACGGMSEAQVHAERREGVAVLTVSDPARRNALSAALSLELADAVEACEADETVSAVVITGEPPAFCAGADLSLLAAGSTPAEREEGLRAIYAGFLAVANCALPTIAAVDGPAVGAGLNLALACDVRLAGPAARFDARFLRLGLHPGGGMTWMVQRAVGPQTAAALALFGDVVGAEEAERIGLVYRVVDGDVVAAAVALAARTTTAPRELVITTKRTMRRTAALGEHADAVAAELGPQVESLSSPAFAERLATARRQRGSIVGPAGSH